LPMRMTLLTPPAMTALPFSIAAPPRSGFIPR
jgi:hypothetical protein